MTKDNTTMTGVARRHILVVDDDPNLLQVLKMRLLSGGYAVSTATDAAGVHRHLTTQTCDLILLDLKLGDTDGIALMEALHADHPGLPVIILTAYGTIQTAVDAMRRGAFSYLTKPFDGRELLIQVEKGLEQQRLSREIQRLRSMVKGAYRFENIIGRSAAIQGVLNQVTQAAQSESSVYIEGKSGTGKELIAKTLHMCSPRREGPFVAINCAAIPETLLESELFGYAKGAFTGADRDRKGLLAEAHGGTFFLDEISEMPLSMQVKLLRALEERTFFPLGSRTTVAVDIRIIAASNKNLEAEIRKGAFREDLYYRIHVIPIKLPTLHERREDIPLLANHFLEKYARAMEKDIKGFSAAAMRKLMSYTWPGNVRELENTIECAVAMSESTTIREEVILRHPFQAQTGRTIVPLRDAKADFERDYLTRLLESTHGNISQASKLAGKYRADFYNLLKKHGLDPNRFRGV
ncbi:MAG: sigma-54 dependent transcriptional regulator [Desulfobacterales bacterium]|nr:sigma-54 dependent transcriptional regulator [Desulfobacterales bacterium]MDJ0875890.1 sigma-54 dependent transcriptional regulator [Desulfobacterales bacterium]